MLRINYCKKQCRKSRNHKTGIFPHAQALVCYPSVGTRGERATTSTVYGTYFIEDHLRVSASGKCRHGKGDLSYHPHIHMIVPAGGLSEDQMEWVPAHKSFFVPVKALSLVFRGILCRLLEQSVASRDMRMPDETPHFPLLKQQCYAKKWVVYCEKPFTSSIRLAKYLGNYTHLVAISNQRILDHKDNQVSFGYKDYRSAGIQRIMKLDAMEFIRRFMQHVLPSGFYKIRYFGFLALCNMKTKLAACFALTDTEPPMPRFEGLPALDVWRSILKTP